MEFEKCMDIDGFPKLGHIIESVNQNTQNPMQWDFLLELENEMLAMLWR